VLQNFKSNKTKQKSFQTIKVKTEKQKKKEEEKKLGSHWADPGRTNPAAA
jgi:hypothetical protein